MAEKKEYPRWEPLSPCHGVQVSREHRFSTDTILLANFSMPGKGDVCMDIGTGCGTIPLLWRIRSEAGKIFAVELQQEAAELAAYSVEKNGFSEGIAVLQGDIRQIAREMPAGGLDLISCNPPYTAEGKGLVNDTAGRQTARHGVTLSLEELADCVSYLLRYGGKFCFCLRPQRLAEAMMIFGEKGLEPKRLRLVQGRKEKAPSLFLLECRRGGKPGMTVEPVLLLEDPAGCTSEEMERIYGDYRENRGWNH